MAVCQHHQSLVGRYKNNSQFINKLNMSGMFIQIGIIGLINGWKHLEIGYYKLIAPLLISMSIYYLIKDFLTLRKIEANMIQLVLDGVELEKKNTPIERVFHRILYSFNSPNILAQRSIINVLTLGCLGYLTSQFISDVAPGSIINRWIFSLFLLVPNLIAGKLYYDSFKGLNERRDKIFSR